MMFLGTCKVVSDGEEKKVKKRFCSGRGTEKNGTYNYILISIFILQSSVNANIMRELVDLKKETKKTDLDRNCAFPRAKKS